MTRLSDTKRDAILIAADRMFSRYGYSKVTMGAIAEAAPVSKPTLYNYFEDKSALFGAVVARQCQDLLERMSRVEAATGSLREDLLQLARAVVDLSYAATTLRLFRLVIAEREAFPELGVLAYRSGAEPVLKGVARVLRRTAQAHGLTLGKPDRSARMLLGLLLGEEHLRCLFGLKQGLSAAEKNRLVGDSVDFYLRAHGVQT